jgi:hypothetical protein
MLLAKGGGLTKDGLDGAVERYLARTYAEKVDFALERALPALQRDGLIRADPRTGTLSAAPLPAAAAALADRWAAALAGSLNDDGGSALAMLTGGGKAAAGAAAGAVGAVGAAGAAVLGGVGTGLAAVGKGLGLAPKKADSAASEAASGASAGERGRSASKFKRMFEPKGRKVE